jgi:hypothetical protein
LALGEAGQAKAAAGDTCCCTSVIMSPFVLDRNVP